MPSDPSRPSDPHHQSSLVFGRWPTKSLFIIDGLGALVSAVMLGFVLVHFQPYIGIPIPSLYFLSIFPVLFFVYDTFCYLAANHRIAICLKIIALANLIYCGISLVTVGIHFDKLTVLGWAYVLGEVTIIVLLARVEWGIGKTL